MDTNNYAISCIGFQLENQGIYKGAPADFQLGAIIPDNQSDAEEYDGVKNLTAWLFRTPSDAIYIKYTDLIDIVGNIVVLNAEGRKIIQPDQSENWGNLPKITMENERIFQKHVIKNVQESDLIDIGPPADEINPDDGVQADNDILRNTLLYQLNANNIEMYTGWADKFNTLQNLDIDGIITRNRLIMSNLSLSDLFFKYNPNNPREGFDNLFQPWVTEYIVAKINQISGLQDNDDIPPSTSIEPSTINMQLQEIFGEIFRLMDEFSKVGASPSNQLLEMRSLIYPFLRLARITTEAWLKDFIEAIFTQDLAKVTTLFSQNLTKMREMHINPSLLSQLIVFLFGQVLNNTEEQTTVVVGGGVSGRGSRQKIRVRDNSLTQQLIRKKQKHFYVSKIRTFTTDPIFLVIQRQLTQNCITNKMDISDRFRVLNLIYSEEERCYLNEIIMARKVASANDNDRMFFDPFEKKDICNERKSIKRLNKDTYKYFKNLDYTNLIPYPSDMTFAVENCSNESMNFMKHIDSYAGLFNELNNREMYQVNNVVCNIHAFFLK